MLKINTKRDSDICLKYKSGKTQQEIAILYSISRERVRQILNRNDIYGNDGGQAVKCFLNYSLSKREIGIRNTLEKKLVLYKCTKDQFYFLRSFSEKIIDTPLFSYKQQRLNAKNRGIDFNLTCWEWWEIWQNSGKYEKRGCGIDKYVMARKGDTGSYSKENVEIIEFGENVRNYIEVYGCNFHKNKNVC